MKMLISSAMALIIKHGSLNLKQGDVAHVKDSQLAVDHGASVYHYERVRTEIMRTFGYFHTESSHHGSEYTPWFRKNKAMIDSYIKTRWDYYEICARHDVEN